MRILFVCTGNTCRSPMAEGLLRKLAREAGLSVEVRSAGVSTADGMSVSPHAGRVLKAAGADFGHSSTRLKSDAVDWADLILTMTESHKRMLLGSYPHAIDKTYTLKEYTLDQGQMRSMLSELERLYADREMKRVLSEAMTTEEQSRIRELERQLPDIDIADPFGGSYEDYQSCAAEIEDCLRTVVRILKKE